MLALDLSPRAVRDLQRLMDFLLDESPLAAESTVELVISALQMLVLHPLVGRPVEEGFRELVISRGKSGYLALYRLDESEDRVLVVAIRHQREAGYLR